MKLSVVIPVYNRAQEVRRCVEGVFACEFPADQYEVIVVDNGSTDGSGEAALAAGARVVHEARPNRCIARNRGAQEARAAWVAFIDSDCTPDRGWLGALMRKIDGFSTNHAVAAIAGRIQDAPPRNTVEEFITRRGWFDQTKYLNQHRPFALPFALTANLCVHRERYLELGGLDAGLPYPGEDADWCWRAADAGFELAYAPDAVVVHYHRSSVRSMWVQSCHWGIGQADLFAKWQARWPRRIWIEPDYYIWAGKALVKTPWRWVSGRDRFARREPFYDFVANTGMIWGRVWGGLRRRKMVL